MASRQDSFAADQHAYIPSAARAAIEQHTQRGVPAHLQQYLGPNRPSYVPERAQRELTAYMQKAVPSHLQQYAGAYVQQNIVTPGIHPPKAPQTTTGRGPAPIPDKLNLSHSGEISAEQGNAHFLNMFQSDSSPQPGAAGANSSYTASQPSSANPNYDFIMNPSRPPKRNSFTFSGSGNATKILFIVGVLFVGVIILILAKGIFGGGNGAMDAVIGVAQDQQELIHISQTATENAQSQAAKDLAFTVHLSLSSQQTQLLTYLKNNGHNPDKKTLALKQSANTDDQLTAAQSASTFDATFVSVVQDKLNGYQRDLKQAYALNPGPKGQQLLSNDYKTANLLSEQLSSPAS